jgi:hypothetical protein
LESSADKHELNNTLNSQQNFNFVDSKGQFVKGSGHVLSSSSKGNGTSTGSRNYALKPKTGSQNKSHVI